MQKKHFLMSLITLLPNFTMLSLGGMGGLLLTLPITLAHLFEVLKLFNLCEKKLHDRKKVKSLTVSIAYVLTVLFTVFLSIIVPLMGRTEALAGLVLFYLPIITPIFWGIGYLVGILVGRE